MPKGNADRTNNPWKMKIYANTPARQKIREIAARLNKDNQSTIGGVETIDMKTGNTGVAEKGDRQARKVDSEEAIKKTHR